MPELTVTWIKGKQTIRFTSGASVSEILETTDFRAPTPCGEVGACGFCRVHVNADAANEPTDGEINFFSENELREGIRLACQVRLYGDTQIEIENPAPLSNWRQLDNNEYEQINFSEQTTQSQYPYGVAADIGTTQIRVSLWDIKKRTRIDGYSALNLQASFGADVLTRLVAATDSDEDARKLGWLAKGAIGEALSIMADKFGLDLRYVGDAVIVGNTAMLCLIAEKNYRLLLQPEYWTREIDCQPQDVSDWNRAWKINPQASVEITQPLAGFVGSDFLAATLATQLTEGVAPALLIDFGTNSEIGLWDGETLWATSAAGGPAFEGSGISCGMPATQGAIFKAERDAGASDFLCEVIGGGEAKGLCGSGLVDVIANLIEAGTLNRAGRFAQGVGAEGVIIAKGRKDIMLKKRDIDVFQRAKAAISAGVVYLLKKGGVSSKDIRRVCVCGAFGSFLNIANAQAIGLLPETAPERVELHGNAALAGCEFLLLSPNKANILEALKEKTKLVNLSQIPEFDELFIQGLYLQPMQSS